MPHTPRPVERGPVRQAVKSNEALKKKLALDRISLKDWEVDPRDVYRNLYGTEPEVDEYTGSLVLPKPARSGA